VLRHELATVLKVIGMEFDIVIKKGNQVAVRMYAIKGRVTLTGQTFWAGDYAHPVEFECF
jgi:hypothetical protein